MIQDLYMAIVTGILLAIAFRYLVDNFGIYKRQFADFITDHRITNLEFGQNELHDKINKVDYGVFLGNSKSIGGTSTSLDYCSVYAMPNIYEQSSYQPSYQPSGCGTLELFTTKPGFQLYQANIPERDFNLNTPPPPTPEKVVEKVVEKIVYVEKDAEKPKPINVELAELIADSQPEEKHLKQDEDSISNT